MSGCFGNSPEDRAREAELHRYLDSPDYETSHAQATEEVINSITSLNAAEALCDNYDLYHHLPELLFSLCEYKRGAPDPTELSRITNEFLADLLSAPIATEVMLGALDKEWK